MTKSYSLPLALLSCLMFIAFCQSATKSREIVGVMVHQVAPDFGPKNKLIGYQLDTTKIYYSDKLRLYHLSYEVDSSDLVTNEKFLSEKRYHYFIYSTDSAFGYDFDTHFLPQGRRVRVDSLLHWQWSPSVNVYSIITVNRPKLLSTTSNRDSGTLYETYSFANEDSSAQGRVVFGYSKKWMSLPYSLSREMDSIKQMKLFEVRYVQDPRYIPAAHMTLDSIKSEYHLKPIETIPPEIVKLFGDYRRLQ
jgi:hypothetical protein